MLIKELQIVGFRSIKQAEFTFQPGMNLLVGVNGVGKTTVLDALRICLSRILSEVTAYQSPKLTASVSSITIGADAMQISCDFVWDGKPFNILVSRKRVDQIINKKGQVVDTPAIATTTPDISTLFPKSKTSNQQPLGLYFSTRRSLIVDKEPSKTSVAGGQAAAFAESLSSDRELNLRLLAQWFDVQEELGKESPISLKHVEVLRNAVSEFLPGFQNLHIVETGGKANFVIEKNGVPFRLAQLSDGERGVLAIVLDLARRLSQANPGMEDPVKDGSAIVLIDELDLHLHPKWQRSIVENLTRTFQNCQFIATTHSPQIIGEVKPERITIIDKSVYQPASSFGMDSSRILEEIMDSESRNTQVDDLISTLSQKIDNENLPEAKELLNRLKSILRPNDPEIVSSETMIDFLESEVGE